MAFKRCSLARTSAPPRPGEIKSDCARGHKAKIFAVCIARRLEFSQEAGKRNERFAQIVRSTYTFRMSRPVIFTISATWDDEASVWSGHCDDIPAAADAPTLDELLAKISAMALDLLPDNHPGTDPADLFLQITALKEADPVAA
jgi:hypothetical protein